MTKKDFEMIARVLRNNLEGKGFINNSVNDAQRESAVRCMVLDFCLEFQKVNPRFDTERFIKAVMENN
tara:strand:- start:31 stop:234 length:204 start_codon:yes stop_codon:yes gene_type:complete